MAAHGPDIAWVDTIDVCHLRCPTCIRGVRGLENTTRKMDMATFAAIVARLKEQGFRRIGLFNWTEPFLNRTIEEYVAGANATGLQVLLSSTLSLPRIDNLERTLAAGVDLLTVSVSGFDQETYEINHVGGVWQYVLANLERVREILSRRRLRTQVDFRMLKFDYNAHQEPLLRGYADRMGFRFELVEGVGDPKSPDALKNLTNEEYVRKGEEAAGRRSPEDDGKACELMFNQVAIDCMGDVYLCCATPDYPALRLGKFLEMSPEQILAKKFTHAFCRACTMPRRERAPGEEKRLSIALRRADPDAPAAPADRPLGGALRPRAS
jgi:MoaA/NifB/PqqE/SkfB family radical SAM enzyme